MNFVVHKILLRSPQHFGGKLPAHHLGLLLAEVPLAIREAISMALRNRSTAQGPRPSWLERASDVRFVDHQGNGETALFFEAPALGESAPEVYSRGTLFSEPRPSPEDTGFDLLADILADVQRQDADSAHFDPPLLNRVTRFHKVFARRSPFTEIELTSRRYLADQPARFNLETIECARRLLGETPAPQRVRVVGQLDGLEASTQRFSVLLDAGEKIAGVFAEAQSDAMRSLWRQRVVAFVADRCRTGEARRQRTGAVFPSADSLERQTRCFQAPETARGSVRNGGDHGAVA